MINTIVDKVKGFLVNPVETFRQSGNDEPAVVFTYFGALLLVHALLATIIVAFGINRIPAYAEMPWGVAVPGTIFVTMLVGGFIATVIFAVWLHLWVYLFGGRRGIMQTVRAVIYGSTPRLILGWIPFIGFIFMLWSLVLGILGIRELHEMSPVKAVLAVACAVMIPLILLILIAAYFITSYMTVTAMPVTTGY